MENMQISELDFTNAAWESLYDAVDDESFRYKDAQLIYNSLEQRLRFISFGDYLKRYIYQKVEFGIPFCDVELSDYQAVIKSSFKEHDTPVSFSPTTAKLSALSKNWLTQQTVKRNVVFLLGFGLGMSEEDVNLFLTKALREPGINPKNPFEVMCWYCYKNKYSYLKFEMLWETYCKDNKIKAGEYIGYGDYTVGLKDSMRTIHDDESLFSYVSLLKMHGNESVISVTARKCFDKLFMEAKELIAEIYNSSDDLLCSGDNKHVYTPDEITESDMERIICSAIPTDRHGNLTPGKASKLNEQFAGKRFSRQHIGEILAGKAQINRFDLITLNFFIFSQKSDAYSNVKQRYTEFYDSTNSILEECFMGKLYVQNPYECFVLMCILSEDPLGTYADVWELSYLGSDPIN